jgi:hypothetical protein
VEREEEHTGGERAQVANTRQPVEPGTARELLPREGLGA